MGEQDALPSTQDAQTGSDIAQAILPEVVISPQVTSGKVIDALKQFLPCEVMVEVVERMDSQRHPSGDAVVVAEELAVVPSLPALPSVNSLPEPEEHHVLLAPSIPSSAPASPSIAPSDVVIQARRKSRKKSEPAVESVAISISPPVAQPDQQSDHQQDHRPALYGGELPRSMMNDLVQSNEMTISSIPSPSWRDRITRMLMPDVIGRLIQHPILSILSGIMVGLLVLWWLLGP